MNAAAWGIKSGRKPAGVSQKFSRCNQSMKSCKSGKKPLRRLWQSEKSWLRVRRYQAEHRPHFRAEKRPEGKVEQSADHIVVEVCSTI